MMEWCAVCLQDDVKVVASQVIQQVPLCKGCVVAYGEEKDVLRDAREFLRDLDSDQPAKAPDPEYFTPDPAPPAIKHLCICGCGIGVDDGKHLIAGHKAKSPESTPPSTRREPDKRLTEQERRALVGPVRAKAPTIPVAPGRYKLKACACGCNTQFAPSGPRAIYADGHKPADNAAKIIRRGREAEVQDRIISSEEIAAGLKLLNQGVPMRDIAAQFNLKYTHVKHHLLRAQDGIDPHRPETFYPPKDTENGTKIVRQTTRKEITAQVVDTQEVETWTAGKERISKLNVELPSGGRLSLEWEGHLFEISSADRNFIFQISDRMREYAKQKAVPLPQKHFTIMGGMDGGFIFDMIDCLDQQEQNQIVDWLDEAIQVVKERRSAASQ